MSLITINDFNKKWQQHWDNLDLDNLRSYDKELWLRFHTLPESKRYPENSHEFETILRRHNLLLEDLASGMNIFILFPKWLEDSENLITPTDRDVIQDKLAAWRAIEEDHRQYYIYKILWHSHSMDRLLTSVINDEVAGVIVVPESMEWLYHPYDGGVDIITSSIEQKNRLKDKYADWLSNHADGL